MGIEMMMMMMMMACLIMSAQQPNLSALSEGAKCLTGIIVHNLDNQQMRPSWRSCHCANTLHCAWYGAASAAAA